MGSPKVTKQVVIYVPVALVQLPAKRGWKNHSQEVSWAEDRNEQEWEQNSCRGGGAGSLSCDDIGKGSHLPEACCVMS